MLVAASRDRDRLETEHVGDLHVDLDVRNCGPFDFDAVEATADAGYELARPQLEAWLASTRAGAEQPPEERPPSTGGAAQSSGMR
jgi:hypothetical protein